MLATREEKEKELGQGHAISDTISSPPPELEEKGCPMLS
jgi:hypothetical protein